MGDDSDDEEVEILRPNWILFFLDIVLARLPVARNSSCITSRVSHTTVERS